MSNIGHNSVAADLVRSYVERIERLEEEKKAISDDIREICVEAKSAGFNAKVIRKLVALRRQDEGKRKEEQSMLDLYASAIGLDLV
jgi:uncharacterized protein (UPF0335 family)